MRNKFTKQAQTALTLAKAAAIDFELGYIGTEHLLLGLLSETEGAAGRVLEEFQVDGKKLVELIDKLVTPAEVGNVTEIEMKPAYSPRTEKVLESAVQRHRILAVRRPERSICSLPCSARRTVLEPGFYIRWE